MPEFIRRAAKLLDGSEHSALIAYLAANPSAGALISGTGGIRKLRWAREGRGKSGGVRVIYYFHNDRFPLYLLTVFGKNEKANVSQAERNELAKLVTLLVRTLEGKNE